MKRFGRYWFLVAAVALVVAADLLSKVWADRVLANPEHPQPLVVTPEEAGRPLRDVVIARFGLTGDDATDAALKDNLLQLREPPGLDPAAPAFADAFAPGSAFAYVTFHRRDLTLAPRVVHRETPLVVDRWLSYLRPDWSAAERRSRVLEHYKGKSLAQFLSERVPALDPDDAVEVAARYTYPLRAPTLGVDLAAPVRPGDLFVLQHRTVTLIPGFLRFIYAENPGAAWGFLNTAPESIRHIILTLISALAAVVILVIYARLKPGHRSAMIAFAAILGGAMGNLVDRLLYHVVIDYIDMYIGTRHWPTYNVADIAITLGVVALLAEMLFVKSSPFNARKSVERAS